MKVYVVSIINYGELANECGGAEILGVYKTKEQAKISKNKYIEGDIADGYLLDEDLKGNYEERDIVTMFSGYQENWNCYYELVIDECEVK